MAKKRDPGSISGNDAAARWLAEHAAQQKGASEGIPKKAPSTTKAPAGPKAAPGQGARPANVQHVAVLELNLFQEAMLKFGDEVDQWAAETHREFTGRIFSKTVIGTPWLTGKAQSNWLVNIGSTTGQVVDAPPFPDPFGPAKAVLRTLKPYQQLYIYNNVEYISELENGWSKKAPHGMLAVAIAEVSEEMGGYVDALDKAVSIDDEEFDIEI